MNEFSPIGSTAQTVQWFISEGLNLVGWALGIPWLGLVTQFLGDFITWAASFFSGRPAVGPDSATDDVALLFVPSANPFVSMWGMGIRSLEAQGIPLSTSDPVNQAKFEKLAAAVLADLQAQFGQNPGLEAFNLYKQASEFNHPDSNANAIALREQADQLYTKAVANGTLDPKTGLPPGTVPAPTPQPPAAPPPPPGGDPDQDEFQDCCDETQTALGAILNAIKGMPQGTDQACCANIVAAVGQVAAAIAGVTAKIPAGGEPAAPVDLTPVVAALTALATAVAAYQPLLTALGTALGIDLKEIAAAIDRNNPDAIVVELKELASAGDKIANSTEDDGSIKAAISKLYDILVDLGVIDSGTRQVISP